ncbi:MAG: MFS transporter, partial [Cyanobacteriota bacterium]|nr:MFS transporter [Cyanobacteriota bacterium]
MSKRTVQAYIEEVPSWEGGAQLAGPPLSGMQWLVWSLATAGKFFEGLIVFMGGIALPLVAEQFAMTGTDKGLVTAATLAGILIGALALGGLADRFGRKPVFIGEMALLAVALLAAACSPGTTALVAALFVIGLALGADYPTAHLVISESIPAAVRGRLVLGAFSFQALGAVLGTAIAAVVLASAPNLNAWRIFY